MQEKAKDENLISRKRKRDDVIFNILKLGYDIITILCINN